MKTLSPSPGRSAAKLIARKETIAGRGVIDRGLISASLLAVPGASAYFLWS